MKGPERPPIPASRLPVPGGFCASSLVATAPFLASGWGGLPSEKAIACGVAAVVLLVISVLVRGVLRLISLAIFLVLAVGAFWLLREGWDRRSEILPPEWQTLADKGLQSPRSREAWAAIQSEFSHLSSKAQDLAAKGGGEARGAMLARVDAMVRDLRKSGNTAEAEELMRLRKLLAQKK